LIDQAAILVGGLGSRLGALAATVPKPLLRVGDRPFVSWALRGYGVRRVVLLAGHLADAVEAAASFLTADSDMQVTPQS
jgi:NDP-sugar pyrophosphorylase family protein